MFILITFFIIFYFLLIDVSSFKNIEISQVSVPHEEYRKFEKTLLTPRLQLNNYLAYQWVDFDGTSRIRKMKIKMKDGMVKCQTSHSFTLLRIVRKEKIDQRGSTGYYRIHVSYKTTEDKLNLMTTLPVTITDLKEEDTEGPNELLPVGYEGYLVCLNKGDQALLASKESNKVPFADPSWITKVKIKMMKNPVAPFGRVYKVTVLDNVNILQDGSKEFIFLLDRARDSLLTVYHLSQAIRDQESGKYCILSRKTNYMKTVLMCNNLSAGLKNNENIYDKLNRFEKIFKPRFLILGALTLFTVNTMYDRDMKEKEYHCEIINNVYTGKPEKYLIENPDNVLNVLQSDSFNKGKSLEKVKSKISYLSYSIFVPLYLLGKLAIPGLRILNLLRDIKLVNKQYREAPYAFKWSLQEK